MSFRGAVAVLFFWLAIEVVIALILLAWWILPWLLAGFLFVALSFFVYALFTEGH